MHITVDPTNDLNSIADEYEFIGDNSFAENLQFAVENYDENTVLTFSYSNTSNSTTIYGYERFRMYKDGQKFLITNRVAASLETLYGFFSIGNSPNYPLYPFSDG